MCSKILPKLKKNNSYSRSSMNRIQDRYIENNIFSHHSEMVLSHRKEDYYDIARGNCLEIRDN
jgi:hypothetical protein